MSLKKLTIRIDDYMYDRLLLVAKEEKTSINKIIGIILKKEIDKPKEINVLEEINKTLNNIETKLISISKKQYFHFNLSLQHFVNQGYFENIDPKNDKCYKELQGKYVDKYNE